MEFFIKNTDQLIDLANYIKKNHSYKLMTFYGDLGAGKTTLIKFICKAFGATCEVSSPSFSILHEYDLQEKNKKIYHFDFYRIKKKEEVYDLGFEEYFFSDQICLIEWPGKIEDLLPQKYHRIAIEIIDLESRKISFFEN